MSRVSVAEHTKLSVFLARGLLRKLAGRLVVHPLLYWQLPGKTDRLVISPKDLRTADATRASEIYAGRFVFAGKVVICDARSPFEIAPPSEDWAVSLLGFGWLRHMGAADSGITRANARALVDEWITTHSAHEPIAWRPEVLARRVISWLSQAWPLLLEDADVRFYRRFIRSLTRHVRLLRRILADAPDGVPRLQVTIALTYASLCMEREASRTRVATKRLADELQRQILPDGGHISRNPGALIELLVDLLPLRQVFTTRNLAPPDALLNAVDRMMPMLRFFRHGDGSFALFNGMGPTPTDLLTTILAYDDARGTPVANAPHSGYQRVEAGGTVVLMDTGGPPPIEVSTEAHAGCLSFELSSRQNRIVVNCGLPATSRESWRQVARGTPAHSTVTFNAASSCRFVDAGPVRRLLNGSPIVGGPRQVTADRGEQEGAVVLRASHDGYAQSFNVIHHRTLMLAADGRRLDGEDVFVPAVGETVPPDRDQFAIRFHLHPSVRANRLSDAHGAMLVMANKEVWTFTAYEDRIDLEESVYLAGNDGPRRTAQLVIHGRVGNVMRVQWTFALSAPPGGQARRGRGEELQLPL